MPRRFAHGKGVVRCRKGARQRTHGALGKVLRRVKAANVRVAQRVWMRLVALMLLGVALCCLQTAFAPVQARAASSASGGDQTSVYVIVYKDGTMVFQVGNKLNANKRVAVDAKGRKAVYTNIQEAFYTSKHMPPWASLAGKIKRVSFKCTFMARHTAWWFAGCTHLRSVNIGPVILGNGGYANSMFKGCRLLQKVDFSKLKKKWRPFATASMFESCAKLTTLKGINAKMDMRILSTCQRMFKGCASLSKLEVPKWKGSKWTRMLRGMFRGCAALESLNMKGFRAEEASDVRGMFRGCSALVDLNLANFEIPQSAKLDNAFKGCASLAQLRLWWQSAFVVETCSELGTALVAGTLTVTYAGQDTFVVRDEPYKLAGKPSSKKIAASVKKI